MKKKLLMLALLIWTTHIVAQKQVHIKDCFDFDWKFTLSDNPEYAKPDYADASWEDIQLPHDWNIKQEFDIKAGGSAAYLPEGSAGTAKHSKFLLPIRDATYPSSSMVYSSKVMYT